MMGHMFAQGYAGNWNDMPDYMSQMMQSYYGGFRPFSSFYGLLHLTIVILIIVLLVALIRWIWKKGN